MKRLDIGVLIVLILLAAFALHKAVAENERHATICLDDRYWVCTETRTHPIGMVMASECVKWERQ